MLNFVGRGNYTHFSINSKFLGKRKGREKMISHFFTAPFYITIFALIPNVVADHLPYMADNLPELEVGYN